MSRRWIALGWGLSLVLHGAALFGATLMALYPFHHCDEPEILFCPVIPSPIRVIDPIERPRECFDWSSRRRKGPAVADDAYSADQEGATGRARICRAAESAVIAALRWLARHQEPRGGWCDESRTCSCGAAQGASEEEVTVLALRAFRLAGYDESSPIIYVDPAFPAEDLHFGEVVKCGKSFLEQIVTRNPRVDLEETATESDDILDVERILSSQKMAASGCLNGSWDPEEGGRAATTARNALRLIAVRKR